MNKKRNPCRAHVLHLLYYPVEPMLHPLSQPVCHLRDILICGVCSSNILILLRDAVMVLKICIFGSHFHSQMAQDWGHEVSGLVLI